MVPSGPFSSRGPQARLVRNRAKGNFRKLLLTSRVLRGLTKSDSLARRRGENLPRYASWEWHGPIQTNHKSLTTRVARGLSDRGSKPLGVYEKV
ncbi:hypothetical protein AVEN_237007-1 [Araneus ventricosus]|uniref:Uncharacterized protein n=1 Tax=Araneus ventricosus TaxID=182803 RepID=A0A4Y2SA03_ARAVE|nr:hypothetical protein AVEN_237007-1 [Araneus ventricosus]